MNLPINLVDYLLYQRIIELEINIILAKAIDLKGCIFINTMEKITAIKIYRAREMFRTLWDNQLKYLIPSNQEHH